MHVIQEPMNRVRLVGVRKSLVIIGYFDGLHPLHQTVVETGIEIAKRNNLPVVLVTFSRKLKKSNSSVAEDLMDNNAKIDFVEKKFRHINYYVEIKILEKTQHTTPQEFMQWLKKTLKATKVVEGEDFTFGYGGQGTIKDLKEFFGEENVTVIPRNEAFSSSKIRHALQAGDIVTAEKILGRDLEVVLHHSGPKPTDWQWNYPQVNLKPGTYHLIDEHNQIWPIKYKNRHHFEWLKLKQGANINLGEHFFRIKKV